MNNINWTKALGFGLIIWAAMALGLWVLSNINALGPLWAHMIAAVIGGATAFLLAGNVRAENGTQAAGYGLLWAAMILTLDLVITQWFDVHVFASWQYWLGPALAFLAPWAQTETRTQLLHSA